MDDKFWGFPFLVCFRSSFLNNFIVFRNAGLESPVIFKVLRSAIRFGVAFSQLRAVTEGGALAPGAATKGRKMGNLIV